MSETSGFFDAEQLVDDSFDREYVAEQWANYFNKFISNGVFINPTNQLKVMAVSGMSIKVLPGWGYINGYWYHNSADLAIAVTTNTTANIRYDGVFLRLDLSERTINIVYAAGRTEVQRTNTVYELKLAQITVAAGATSIPDAVITDTRSNSTVCGFVSGLIDQVDITDLYTQFEDYFNTFITTEQADFEEWVASLHDILDTETAGHLQLEIDGLDSRIDGVSSRIDNLRPSDIGAANSTHNHTTSEITDLASWAKQPNKPTYTASEVGAAPASWDKIETISSGGSKRISTSYKELRILADRNGKGTIFIVDYYIPLDCQTFMHSDGTDCLRISQYYDQYEITSLNNTLLFVYGRV